MGRVQSLFFSFFVIFVLLQFEDERERSIKTVRVPRPRDTSHVHGDSVLTRSVTLVLVTRLNVVTSHSVCTLKCQHCTPTNTAPTSSYHPPTKCLHLSNVEHRLRWRVKVGGWRCWYVYV